MGPSGFFGHPPAGDQSKLEADIKEGEKEEDDVGRTNGQADRRTRRLKQEKRVGSIGHVLYGRRKLTASHVEPDTWQHSLSIFCFIFVCVFILSFLSLSIFSFHHFYFFSWPRLEEILPQIYYLIFSTT